MKTCYILIGPAAAGKTTWVMDRLRPEDEHVSLDIYRLQFFRHTHPEHEDVQYDVAWTYCCSASKQFDEYVNGESKLAFAVAAKNGSDVYVDNTNLTAKSRKSWIQLARKHRFKVVAVEFNRTLGKVLAQNSARTDKFIPENVIKDQFYRQECVQLGSEVDDLLTIK